MDTIKTRMCKQCRIEQNMEEFHKRGNNRREYVCKSCIKINYKTDIKKQHKHKKKYIARTEGTKTCKGCHKKKHVSEFNKNAVLRDGLSSKCKECTRTYHNNKYHTEYKGKYIQRKVCGCCGREKVWRVAFHPNSDICNMCYNQPLKEFSAEVRAAAKDREKWWAKEQRRLQKEIGRILDEPSISGFKVCKTCEEDKPVQDFARFGAGHRNSCIECGGISEKQQKTQLILSVKSQGCAYCDEKEVCCMDLHHYDSSTKQFALYEVFRKPPRFAYDIIKTEINKCIVVCVNCHKKIHKGDITANQEDICNV